MIDTNESIRTDKSIGFESVFAQPICFLPVGPIRGRGHSR